MFDITAPVNRYNDWIGDCYLVHISRHLFVTNLIKRHKRSQHFIFNDALLGWRTSSRGDTIGGVTTGLRADFSHWFSTASYPFRRLRRKLSRGTTIGSGTTALEASSLRFVLRHLSRDTTIWDGTTAPCLFLWHWFPAGAAEPPLSFCRRLVELYDNRGRDGRRINFTRPFSPGTSFLQRVALQIIFRGISVTPSKHMERHIRWAL